MEVRKAVMCVDKTGKIFIPQEKQLYFDLCNEKWVRRGVSSNRKELNNEQVC